MTRKIKVPKHYSPGKGHPRERLAYLSPAEMVMLKMMTDGKSDMTKHGIPSFVDASMGGGSYNSGYGTGGSSASSSGSGSGSYAGTGGAPGGSYSGGSSNSTAGYSNGGGGSYYSGTGGAPGAGYGNGGGGGSYYSGTGGNSNAGYGNGGAQPGSIGGSSNSGYSNMSGISNALANTIGGMSNKSVSQALNALGGMANARAADRASVSGYTKPPGVFSSPAFGAYTKSDFKKDETYAQPPGSVDQFRSLYPQNNGLTPLNSVPGFGSASETMLKGIVDRLASQSPPPSFAGASSLAGINSYNAGAAGMSQFGKDQSRLPQGDGDVVSAMAKYQDRLPQQSAPAIKDQSRLPAPAFNQPARPVSLTPQPARIAPATGQPYAPFTQQPPAPALPSERVISMDPEPRQDYDPNAYNTMRQPAAPAYPASQYSGYGGSNIPPQTAATSDPIGGLSDADIIQQANYMIGAGFPADQVEAFVEQAVRAEQPPPAVDEGWFPDISGAIKNKAAQAGQFVQAQYEAAQPALDKIGTASKWLGADGTAKLINWLAYGGGAPSNPPFAGYANSPKDDSYYTGRRGGGLIGGGGTWENDDGEGDTGGNPPPTPPGPPPVPPGLAWQYPIYSQYWAFAPGIPGTPHP